MTALRIVCALALSANLFGCNWTSSPQSDPSTAPAQPAVVRAARSALPAKNLGVLRSWFEPTSPFKIVGPIYFVGTRGLGVYLITTQDGHILLDGGMPSSAKDIEASVRALGFKPQDIKILLITHAHIDHAGTVAHFKKLAPAATVAVMDGDAEILESGGRSDPVYGKFRSLHYAAVHPDRVLKDGSTISLGDITMTARKSAGHSPGCTTWITTVSDGGQSYEVVFPGSSNVNPGMRLFVDPSWLGIDNDFRSTFRMLESLKPDIFLGAHTQTFAFEDKRLRMGREGVVAWVDPDGYRVYVAKDKAKFEALLAKEKGE